MDRGRLPEEEAAAMEAMQAEEAEAQEGEAQAEDGQLRCHQQRRIIQRMPARPLRAAKVSSS